MAMVRQLTESELINGSTPEDDSHSSEHMECYSRPQSRASSGSKRDSPSASMPQLQYSKEDLMKFSTYPLSQNWPSCLDPAYNNSTGKWDPERWFMNHRSDRIGPVEETRSKRERTDDSTASHKRKSSDPKERIKDEKDDIVLSPQRRSFGTGCHVIQQSSLARRPGSPTDSRDLERDTSRRIGSGRIMTRDRDQRDWERDREYGYNSGRSERRDRFDQEDTEKDVRRYSSRYNRNDRRSRGRDRIDEVEPEWFSGGPTSQSETIELVGFEDPHHEDETRKPSKKSSKRAKQNSRRSSLKSEEGEKIAEQIAQEDNCGRKGNSLSEEPKNIENKSKDEEVQSKTNAGFDLDELFRMDWIPGLMPNESPPDNVNNEIGCSRFSQWFRRESPLPESGSNSRRSSLHEELIANVLNSIAEPQIIIPSPVPNSSDNFFAPISPAISQSSTYSAPQSGTSNCSNNKDIMKMLQSVNTGDSLGEGGPKGPVRSVRELEADLKRIVLGEQNQHEERSAFDKLLRHMSDSRSSPTVSMSMGPLDKSKALQEQDLLQDILGGHQTSISPMLQQFQMFKDDKTNVQPLAGGQRSQYNMSTNQARSEMLAHLVQQQKQQEQHLQQVHQQQIQQQQMQNHLLQQTQPPPPQNVQGFTVDMLAKILGPSSQAPLSPVSPGVQQSASAPSLTRNDPQMLNSVLQYQRQRELLSSILKQQQHSNNANLSQPNLLQTIQQHRCPSSKEIPVQQTLGLPTLGISPRQSPLPPEAISSAISSQGRIPSPLVFGQQPPALSHAPAPIHPAAIVQAMAQNAANPNTLQVQNPVVLQRVPSPQELAVHTQSILQNALIKRKLEEQKENFRKRQEAQRTSSPIASAKNGTSVSPLKGLSPTIAFTPTSVMRKIHSEKTENKEQKMSMQNGNKIAGASDIRLADSSQNTQKISSIGICTSMENNIGFSNSIPTSHNNNVNQVPRAVHGQALGQPRSIHGMNSGPPVILPGQGRPIVKVGLGQGLSSTSDISRTSSAANKASIGHNKSFMASNNQANTIHPEDPCFDSMGKFQWHHQLSRQQSTTSVPQLQMAAATYAALNHRPPPALNPHHPNILRPVNMASPGNVPASNVNFPLLRNAVQNPIRAQSNPINQLNSIQHLASLQLQQRGIDSRQLQALAQAQRFHPAALQQLLLNSQNQVTAAQAQVVSGFPGNRDTKHLLSNQSSANSQSPSKLSATPGNLAKWFGNDVLKQKMPEMPPVSHQKALLVEEVERQQQ